MSATSESMPRSQRSSLVGRTFLSPVFDYLVIGGGLSLIVIAGVLYAGAAEVQAASLWWLPTLALACNSAHFASSTVRLYTKPGSFEQWPILTMVFPLLTLAFVTVCIAFGSRLGPHVQSLYLTWSPYHYAAQAYGLAVMYCMRSGFRLSLTEKRLLRWACLFPFGFVVVANMGVGVDWLVPASVLAIPLVAQLRLLLSQALMVAAVAAPLLFVLHAWRGHRGPPPAISLLLVISNGIWWLLLTPLNAFLWATIFHGLQYLAIVIIFHVRDHVPSGDTRGAAYQAIRFYAISLVLAYALFHCLPLGFTMVGLGRTESFMMVIATINLHHFVVDAFIWRLREAKNQQLAGAPAPA